MLVAGILLCVTAVSQAEDEENDLWNRETLTNGFGGLSDNLADKGIEVGLGFTQIYQQNVRGGAKQKAKATKAAARTAAAQAVATKAIPMDDDKSDSADDIKEFNS